MNTLGLLFVDELKGFYKSKVMAILWIGMPLLSVLMHVINPDAEGIPISSLVGLLVASIGGTLASVMLSTSIVGEKNRHVYDLFFIRNQNIRSSIILSKYLAVYLCLAIAAGISLVLGFIIDTTILEISIEKALEETFKSLAISLAAMSIACAAGILIGILLDSVPAAAILAVYLGNQMSLLAILPGILLENIDPVKFAAIVGVGLTLVLLTIDLMIFRKKQF